MIIFLHGPDGFRAKKKLKELKKQFRQKVDQAATEMVEIDGEKATLNQINGLIRPASLFSKKRMAVITDIFLNKNADLFGQLLKILKKEEKGENIIIFLDPVSAKEKLSAEKKELHKFLASQKYSMAFPLLERDKLAKWIRQEAVSAGAEINGRAADLLSGLTENLWQTNNELQKLIAYKKSLEANGAKGQLKPVSDEDNARPDKSRTRQIKITEEDIYKLVQGKLDTNIFTLTDAIGAGNKGFALKLLKEQLESGAAETYLISMIIRQFKIILQLREALESKKTPAQIASDLKLHPFIVRKGLGQARLFSISALKNIVSRLIKMDYDLKTGRGDLKTNLSLLIAGLK